MRLVAVALTWLTTSVAVAVDADAILGTWATEDLRGNRDSIVEFVRKGEQFAGSIVWVRYGVYPDNDPKGMGGQPIRDRENPDPALRERPILGLQIVSGLHFDGEQWQGGRIYSPREGATYGVQARLENADTLEVRGYFGTPFLGKTVTWRRARIPRL